MSFFKAPAMPAAATPVAPPAPPNPPMFGQSIGKKKPQQQPSQQFTASVLGSLPSQSARPGLTGAMKSVLGG